MVIALPLSQYVKYLLRQCLTAFAALGEDLRQGDAHAHFLTMLLDERHFLGGIGRECVDCNNDRQAELADIFDVCVQVDDTLCQCVDVGLVEVRLCHAAVILESADGSDQNDTGRS